MLRAVLAACRRGPSPHCLLPVHTNVCAAQTAAVAFDAVEAEEDALGGPGQEGDLYWLRAKQQQQRQQQGAPGAPQNGGAPPGGAALEREPVQAEEGPPPQDSLYPPREVFVVDTPARAAHAAARLRAIHAADPTTVFACDTEVLSCRTQHVPQPPMHLMRPHLDTATAFPALHGALRRPCDEPCVSTPRFGVTVLTVMYSIAKYKRVRCPPAAPGVAHRRDQGVPVRARRGDLLQRVRGRGRQLWRVHARRRARGRHRAEPAVGGHYG